MTSPAKTRSARWSTDEIARLVSAGSGWMQGVSIESLRDAVGRGRVQEFKPGDRLACHLQPMDDAIVVLEGVLRVFSLSPDGKEHVISLMEPGAILGLLACLDGGPSPHEAVADNSLTVLLLPACEFRKLMAENKEVRDAILNLLCERFRMALSMLDQFAIGSPDARLAQRLLAMAEAYGSETGEGTLIKLHLTQESLAAMIGLSRQRTNIILKKFQEQKLIRMDYGKVVLLNRQTLQNIVSETS